MKKFLIAAVAACALVLAATAGAALEPGVFDPGNTGCPTSSYTNGVLHLAKNCVSSTNASAGANITGLSGQTFQSASFTLASASQCQGGSPRFNVFTSNGTFFLGCNNVTPTPNGDGTATYTFTAATLAAAGQQVPVPTGTINSVEVLIDQRRPRRRRRTRASTAVGSSSRARSSRTRASASRTSTTSCTPQRTTSTN